MFVAGALALIGFRALIGLPYFLIPHNGVRFFPANIAANAVLGLALLIGIAILVGIACAIRLAQIYLWLWFGSGAALVFISVFHIYSPKGPHFDWGRSIGLLTPMILLALLAWSHSKRFQNETDA